MIKTGTNHTHQRLEEDIGEEDMEEEMMESSQGDVSLVMKWAISHTDVLSGLKTKEKIGESL